MIFFKGQVAFPESLLCAGYCVIHFLYELFYYIINHNHHALFHPWSLDKEIHMLRTFFGFLLLPQHLPLLSLLFTWIILLLFQNPALAQVCLGFPGPCFLSIQYLYHALSQSITFDCNMFSSLKSVSFMRTEAVSLFIAMSSLHRAILST